MKKEIFKTIPGFEDYQVSNLGNVKSLKFNKEKILKGGISKGYKTVSLYKNTIMHKKKVSILVLITFIDSCPKGMECSHLDGNSLNDNLENLKWETEEKNQQRRVKHKTDNRGERNGNAKLTNKKVIQIKKLLKEERYTHDVIAIKFNVSQPLILYIKNKYNWSHV